MRNVTRILNQQPAFASVVLTVVAMLGLTPKAHAEQQCSTASLRGGYGFHAFATIVPAGTPRAIIAVFTFDGSGGYSGTVTLNDNGSIAQFPDTGTYAMNSDCTGKLFPNTGGSSEIVVVDGGNEFYQIRLEPSSIVVFATAKKLSPGNSKRE